MAKTDYEKRIEQRKQDIAEAVSGLMPGQWQAINEAHKALLNFDLDYYECYEICDASIPKQLKMALVGLQQEFGLPNNG